MLATEMARGQEILDLIFAINSETDYYRLLNLILSKMRELTNCDAGTLYVIEDNKLHFKIMHNDSLQIYKLKDDEILLPPVELGNNTRNVSARSAINNEYINIPDVYEDVIYNFQGPKDYDKITGYKTTSMLVFPLVNVNNEVVGVLQLINALDKDTTDVIAFDENLYPVLRSVSSIAAVVLSNIQYTVEIKEQFNSFVKIMSAAIDERTPYNATHTKMIAKYAQMFSDFLNEKMGKDHAYYFNTNRQEQLVMAALLHDIGKIVTPLEIMNKPTRLGQRLDSIRYKFSLKKLQLEIALLKKEISQNDLENEIITLSQIIGLIENLNAAPFVSDDMIEQILKISEISYISENGSVQPILDSDDVVALSIQKGTLSTFELGIMREHVVVTDRLLKNIKFNRYYKNVPTWAAMHHEFLDGTGYPNHVSDLPIEVCILTILDIYDALIARDRPYKRAIPPEGAHKILMSMADEGKLHKELVALFVESKIGV